MKLNPGVYTVSSYKKLNQQRIAIAAYKSRDSKKKKINKMKIKINRKKGSLINQRRLQEVINQSDSYPTVKILF